MPARTKQGRRNTGERIESSFPSEQMMLLSRSQGGWAKPGEKEHYVQELHTGIPQAPLGADWTKRFLESKGEAAAGEAEATVSGFWGVPGIPHFIVRTVTRFEQGCFCSNVGSRGDEWIQELELSWGSWPNWNDKGRCLRQLGILLKRSVGKC